MATEEIVTIGGDSIGLIDALSQVVAAVDDVRLALESIGGAGSASLQDVVTAINDMSSSAGEASGEMSSLAASTGEAAAGGEGLRGTMEGLTGALGETIGRATELAAAFLEFQAIAGVIEAVQHFVGNMIGMNEQFQRLDTTLKDMVGSQRAQQLIDWVKQFGTQVPFTTEAVMNATVSLTAFRQNAEQVLPALSAVAAEMASRGVTLDTATRAFIDALNGRWLMMQNQLGITKEMLVPFGLQVSKTGKILNDSFVPAFEKFAAAKFPSALHDQMQTFGGQLAEANDLLQLFAARIGAPLFDMFQQGLGAAMQWVQDHQHIINDLGDSIGRGLAGAFQLLGDIIGPLFQVIQGGVGWFQQMSGDVKQAVGPVSQLAGAAQTAAGHMGGFATVASNLKAPLKDLQGPLAPIVGMFRDIAGAVQAVIGFFEPVPGSTKKVTYAMREWVQTGDGVGHWKTKVVTSLMDIPGQASGFVQFLQSLGDAFSKAFNDPKGVKLHQLATDLKDLTDAFISLGEWLAGTGGQILQDAATVLGSIASSIADATGNLQQMFPNLNLFQGILQIIVDVYLAKLLVQIAALALQGVNSIIQFGTAAKQWVGNVSTTFQNLETNISNAVDWLKNKFSPAAQEAGSQASTSAGEVDALATAEGDVVTQAEGSAAVQDLATAEKAVVTNADASAVAGLATAEGDVGVQAATAAPAVGGLATEEDAAGAAADGAATGIGAMLGPIGLLMGLVVAASPQLEQFGNSLMNWMGITVIGSPQWMDQMQQMVQFFGEKHDAKAFDAWLDVLEKMPGVTQEEIDKLKALFDEVNAKPPPGMFRDILGNLLDLANYADQAAIDLHNMNAELFKYMSGAGFENPTGYHPGGGGHGGGHPHASGGTVGANEPWQVVSEDGLELALLGPGAAKLPTGSRIFTAAQTAGILPFLGAGPMIGGVPLGAFGGGAGGGFGGNAVEGLLSRMLVQIEQLNRSLPMTGSPASATTGSFTPQFYGSNFNFNTISNLASLQAELNLLSGLTIEAAMRGAING